MTLALNYLSLATNWKAQLPPDVVADLDDPMGPYKGFPHYSTAAISLSVQQVTLLAAHATWVVEAHQDEYRAVLGA